MNRLVFLFAALAFGVAHESLAGLGKKGDSGDEIFVIKKKGDVEKIESPFVKIYAPKRDSLPPVKVQHIRAGILKPIPSQPIQNILKIRAEKIDPERARERGIIVKFVGSESDKEKGEEKLDSSLSSLSILEIESSKSFSGKDSLTKEQDTYLIGSALDFFRKAKELNDPIAEVEQKWKGDEECEGLIKQEFIKFSEDLALRIRGILERISEELPYQEKDNKKFHVLELEPLPIGKLLGTRDEFRESLINGHKLFSKYSMGRKRISGALAREVEGTNLIDLYRQHVTAQVYASGNEFVTKVKKIDHDLSLRKDKVPTSEKKLAEKYVKEGLTQYFDDLLRTKYNFLGTTFEKDPSEGNKFIKFMEDKGLTKEALTLKAGRSVQESVEPIKEKALEEIKYHAGHSLELNEDSKLLRFDMLSEDLLFSEKEFYGDLVEICKNKLKLEKDPLNPHDFLLDAKPLSSFLTEDLVVRYGQNITTKIQEVLKDTSEPWEKAAQEYEILLRKGKDIIPSAVSASKPVLFRKKGVKRSSSVSEGSNITEKADLLSSPKPVEEEVITRKSSRSKGISFEQEEREISSKGKESSSENEEASIINYEELRNNSIKNKALIAYILKDNGEGEEEEILELLELSEADYKTFYKDAQKKIGSIGWEKQVEIIENFKKLTEDSPISLNEATTAEGMGSLPNKDDQLTERRDPLGGALEIDQFFGGSKEIKTVPYPNSEVKLVVPEVKPTFGIETPVKQLASKEEILNKYFSEEEINSTSQQETEPQQEKEKTKGRQRRKEAPNASEEGSQAPKKGRGRR